MPESETYVHRFLLGRRQHNERGTAQTQESEHAIQYHWALVSSLRAWINSAKRPYGQSILGSQGMLFVYAHWLPGLRGRAWHMDCLEGCICFGSIHASLCRGHTKTRWHTNHAPSLFHFHFTHFRDNSFGLVCYQQKMHSRNSRHFPVEQNGPKYSKFFAKVEFSYSFLEIKNNCIT